MSKAAGYPRLFERLYDKPLLLLPDRAFAIERAFQAQLGQSAAAMPVKAFFDDADPVDETVDDPEYDIAEAGIAVIPVIGTLVQRASWLDAMCGMTSYASIGFAFDQALADPKVKGILLEIDSGGGEVNGCFDLVDQIAASTKPVWAVANEAAYSAAYAIASAADRIIAPRTAGVGSIGVFCMHVDQSQRDAKQGLVYTPIFAGDHKIDGHSHAPLPDSVRAAVQADMDRIYQLFTSTVAANRSISADAVIATQADTFHTTAAIELGLADDIGTLGDAVTQFADFLAAQSDQAPAASRAMRWATRQSMKTSKPPAVSAASSEGVLMDPKDQAAQPASITPEALATARTEAQAAGTTAGAQAERDRIGKILGSDEAKGRGALANHLALETGMSADDAVKLLAKSPKEAPLAAATNAFEAAMDKTTNPNVHADNGDGKGEDGEESVADAAAAIAAFQRKPASAAK